MNLNNFSAIFFSSPSFCLCAISSKQREEDELQSLLHMWNVMATCFLSIIGIAGSDVRKKKTTEGRRGNPVAPNKETSVPYCSGDLLSSNECFLYRQQSQCTYRRTVKLDFMQHQNRFIYTPLLGEQRYTKSQFGTY